MAIVFVISLFHSISSLLLAAAIVCAAMKFFLADVVFIPKEVGLKRKYIEIALNYAIN